MDHTLLISLSAVIVLGLFVLDSAAASKGTNYVLRQGAFIGVGFAVVLGLLRFDYTILKKYSKYFYIFALLFFAGRSSVWTRTRWRKRLVHDR